MPPRVAPGVTRDRLKPLWDELLLLAGRAAALTLFLPMRFFRSAEELSSLYKRSGRDLRRTYEAAAKLNLASDFKRNRLLLRDASRRLEGSKLERIIVVLHTDYIAPLWLEEYYYTSVVEKAKQLIGEAASLLEGSKLEVRLEAHPGFTRLNRCWSHPRMLACEEVGNEPSSDGRMVVEKLSHIARGLTEYAREHGVRFELQLEPRGSSGVMLDSPSGRVEWVPQAIPTHRRAAGYARRFNLLVTVDPYQTVRYWRLRGSRAPSLAAWSDAANAVVLEPGRVAGVHVHWRQRWDGVPRAAKPRLVASFAALVAAASSSPPVVSCVPEVLGEPNTAVLAAIRSACLRGAGL